MQPADSIRRADLNRACVKVVSMLLIASFVSSGCGRALSAIRRHTEIERPVAAKEITGRWVLTTNSLNSVIIDGFAPNKGEELGFTVRSNGSYFRHTISPGWDGSNRVVERRTEEGLWSLTYNTNDVFRNTLFLRSSSNSFSSVKVALDANRLVLWTHWGDPDDGVDLVYEKVSEP